VSLPAYRQVLSDWGGQALFEIDLPKIYGLFTMK
jgi:hypothetical protein